MVPEFVGGVRVMGMIIPTFFVVHAAFAISSHAVVVVLHIYEIKEVIVSEASLYFFGLVFVFLFRESLCGRSLF